MAVFRGSGVAIVTPFKKDDLSVNYDAFADIIEDQIEKGSDAIVVCGSTGESATMTEQEHVEVCKFCVEQVRGRIPVVAGSGSNDTRVAIQLSRDIAAFGADAVLVITPYYNKATQNGLYAHFMAIDKEVNVPVIMYNVPSRTGCNLTPATTARIFRDSRNVKGIKEASGNISQVVELMTLTDGEIDLYSGNDDQVVPLLSMGGIGVISVVANIAPKAMHDMCELYFAGRIEEAAKLQRDTFELFSALFSEVNPIPVKKAVELMGFNPGPLRMPLTELESAHTEQLKKAMQGFGLI
ncbi:MAG: 4-hydroxy-tetrahydrodipicolinate synthase [Lachnospiraceae bacterium]|nr:4-hydroxy-tetrahydrodipicolinate synthase [Lachnospiraceae bacterium]